MCGNAYFRHFLQAFQRTVSVSVFILVLNHLNAKLNPICHLLALLGAHHILHVSRIRVNYHELWDENVICAALHHVFCWPGSVVGIVTGYGLDGPGNDSRWEARFSAPVQNGTGA